MPLHCTQFSRPPPRFTASAYFFPPQADERGEALVSQGAPGRPKHGGVCGRARAAAGVGAGADGRVVRPAIRGGNGSGCRPGRV
eukprot:scaffold28131_cov101-Isochrysis_galbana.AAC.1